VSKDVALQSFSPHGIGMRIKIGQFWLILEDKAGRPEPPGKRYLRFGISSSNSGSWLGAAFSAQCHACREAAVFHDVKPARYRKAWYWKDDEGCLGYGD
jgi:hypothetical protein